MLHRRDFAKLALAAVPALAARSAPAPRTIVKPPKLADGDWSG